MGAEEVKASPPRLSEEEDICNNVVVRIDGRLTKLSTTITTTRQRIVDKRKERDMQKRNKNRIPKVERDLEENMEWMEDDDKKYIANQTLLSSGRRSRLREHASRDFKFGFRRQEPPGFANQAQHPLIKTNDTIIQISFLYILSY